MTHSAVQTDNAPKPVGAYSQGRVAGPFVFTAGMGALDPKTGAVLADGDVAAQTGIVLDHLAAILAAAGQTLDDVLKVTVHLADLHRDFAAFNRVYQSRLTEPFPARTTVGSTLAAGILVEIDVVAYSD